MVALGRATYDDEEHLRSCEALTLPLEAWTHRAHVKVAFTYLRRYSFDEALGRMRERAKAYNARHGVPEGPASGYNETTTRASMHLVAATLSAYGQTQPTPDADGFCDTHPQLMNEHVLRLFYSLQRRMHPLAKGEFVEPDLAPLPQIVPAAPSGR